MPHRARMPRASSALLRLLALVLALLPLAPSPLALAQGVAPAATLVCPTGLRLEGPTNGSAGSQSPYVYRATVTPAETWSGVTIHWRVTDQADRTNTGLSAEQGYAWAVGGIKTVLVGVEMLGCARLPDPVSLTVYISPMPVRAAPAEAYRLAAQLVEQQRATLPGWAEAQLTDPADPLNGTVTPLWRPDVTDGPAYWEFVVFNRTGGELQPHGYIIVSTGEHDYPIANWAPGGWSPTRRLRVDSGWTADRFWKLDVLSYAAEDRTGAPVALRGDPPPKVTLPAGWADSPPPMMTTSWVPATITSTVDLADGSIPVVPGEEIVGEPPVKPTLGNWASWADLKRDYRTTYAPFTAALRENAAPTWEALRLTNQYGYTLFKGDSLTYPAQYPDPSFGPPVGPAVDEDLVDWTIAYPAGLAARLVITATADLFYQAVPLTATITYAGGITDVVRVNVVNYPENWVRIPVIRGGRGGSSSAAASAAEPAVEPFPHLAAAGDEADEEVAGQEVAPGRLEADGYTYWYVGGTLANAEAQQAWYDQYTVPGSCKSGCGPTAWAMLIAWGDIRAHSATLPWWAGRIGLYRLNGGRGDPTVIAPTAVDAGVKNMVEEIRGHVSTFCNAFNSSGATLPETMHLVVNYLQGRSGMSINTWTLPGGFSVTGADGDTVRSMARNVLRNPEPSRRPTVIGTGWLSHYPLAYGYRQKTEQVCRTDCKLVWGKTVCTPVCYNQLLKGFYVNQGWGDGVGEWVNTDIWFTGRMTPGTSGIDDTGLYRSATDAFYFDWGHDLEGQWYWKYPAGTMPYALRPVVGDFDRDGVVDDLAHYVHTFWDSGKRYDWYFDYDTNAGIDVILDQPIVGADGWPIALDADRDGFVDDIALYEPIAAGNAAMLCVQTNRTGAPVCQGYAGVNGDYRLPVSGDFDGDGYHDDLGFYSQATRKWYFDLNHDRVMDGAAVQWPTGSGGVGAEAKPFAGDFDLDGQTDDVGAYDPATRRWWFDNNHNGGPTHKTGWGEYYDLPFAGNFDTN